LWKKQTVLPEKEATKRYNLFQFILNFRKLEEIQLSKKEEEEFVAPPKCKKQNR